MRLRLALIAVAIVFPSLTQADSVVLRGNYYRDRNTSILQPEIDFSKEIPSGTVFGAHYLLDSITSASVAAGAVRDQPFTELRHEVGVRLGQRFGRALLTGAYSYSTESDYRAQTATLSSVVDLFQKNTTLGLTLSYGHNNVFSRASATNAIPVGSLDTLAMIASWSQVLSQTLLLSLSYDFIVSGFGSLENGYQANPYRPVNLGGSPTREELPLQRLRHSLALQLNWILPLGSARVPWIGVRPSYRFYIDDWGVLSNTFDLRLSLPVDPVEFRVTGRYYAQGAASFWSDQGDDVAFYQGQGKACAGCGSSATGKLYYTADPKLSEFRTYYLEARVLLKLRFLRKLSHWLSAGTVDISYGRLFTERALRRTFGDASVAGLQFEFPL